MSTKGCAKLKEEPFPPGTIKLTMPLAFTTGMLAWGMLAFPTVSLPDHSEASLVLTALLLHLHRGGLARLGEG